MKKSVLFVLLLLLVLTSCTAVTPPVETSASTGTNGIETGTESSVPVETTPETQTEISIQEEMTEANTEPNEPTVTIPIGSFSTDAYTVTQVSDQYYLNFLDGNDDSAESNPSLSITTVFFPSVAAMKHAILTNSFSKAELQIIKNSFSKNENGIMICDLNRLYEPVLPEGYTLDGVTWEGAGYELKIKGNEASGGGHIQFRSQDTWDSVYQYEMEQLSKFNLLQQESSTYDGASSETYVYTTGAAKLKDVYLTIPSENRSTPTKVIMHYCLEHSDPEYSVSDTVPRTVEIYGEDNGQHFKVLFLSPTTAPTVEWLSSFGITPCVGTSDQVVS